LVNQYVLKIVDKLIIVICLDGINKQDYYTFFFNGNV